MAGMHKPHVFGGEHTVRKLDIVHAYLQEYVYVFKNMPDAVTIYADPFAGTGYWQMPALPSSESALFPDSVPSPSKEDGPRLGSALRALQVQPRFHEYRFADVDEAKVRELDRVADEYRRMDEFRGRKIVVEQADANEFVVRLCKTLSSPHPRPGKWWRAVVFLDPYGMQVNWKSLERLGETKKVDLWCLFPMEGVVRQISASNNLEQEGSHKVRRLAACLGLKPQQLREEFFALARSVDGSEYKKKIVQTNSLEKLVHERLQNHFKGMVADPIRIPETGHHLFSLFYALANTNPKARKKAQEIVRRVQKRFP